MISPFMFNESTIIFLHAFLENICFFWQNVLSTVWYSYSNPKECDCLRSLPSYKWILVHIHLKHDSISIALQISSSFEPRTSYLKYTLSVLRRMFTYCYVLRWSETKSSVLFFWASFIIIIMQWHIIICLTVEKEFYSISHSHFL